MFSKAADIVKLLNMLKETDLSHGNLADNEEIQVRSFRLDRWNSAKATHGTRVHLVMSHQMDQELYKSCKALGPNIIRLIDKRCKKWDAACLLSPTSSDLRT